MHKSDGVVEKEIVFPEQQDTISDSVSGLVMKESLAVVDIEVIEEETTVYNFEVEDDHTYFVTEAELWVHNADYVINKGVGGQITSFRGKIFGKEIPENANIQEIDGKIIISFIDEFENEIEFLMDPKFIRHSGGDQTGLATPMEAMINRKKFSDGKVVHMDSDGRLNVLDKNSVKDGSLVFVNGQDNDVADALTSLNGVRNVMESNKEAYLAFNSTGAPRPVGGLIDTVKSLFMRGNATESNRSAINSVAEIASDAISSGKKITFIAHSQGSPVTGNGINIAVSQTKKDPSNINLVVMGGAERAENIPNKLNSAIYVRKQFDPVIDSANLFFEVIPYSLQQCCSPGNFSPTPEQQRAYKIQQNKYIDVRTSGNSHSFDTYLRETKCALSGRLQPGSNPMEKCR